MIQLRRWILVLISVLSICAVVGSAVWQKYYYAVASTNSAQSVSPDE